MFRRGRHVLAAGLSNQPAHVSTDPPKLEAPPVHDPPECTRAGVLFITPEGEARTMRTIRNYVQAEKARREENGDEGFSLIELIVVVVILGILAAIAIPVFMNIQQTAKDNALDQAASNGAVVVATAISQDTTTIAALNTELAKSADEGYTLTMSSTAEPVTLQNYCVTAEAVDGKSLDGGADGVAGPGCP